MRRLLWVGVTACMLTACGTDAAEEASTPASEGPATTTGLVPSGVPTEGSRPPADNLPPPAEPAQAGAPTQPAPGRQVAVGSAPEGIVVDPVTRTVAVATRNPNQLVLLDADTGEIRTRTALPGAVRHLQLAQPGGPVLVPVESANALVRVDLPGGQARPQVITGTVPHDATQAPDGTVFVANELGGTVTVLRGDEIVKVFSDSVQPAGLTPVGDRVGLLDVRKNDLTIYDVTNLTIVGSTPAGEGPTHLVADKHGRMIAADTRGDAVRVFDTEPKQLAEIAQPGAPYGITYDGVRDRLWVASSGTNEVVGYDMTDPTPREVARIPTVQNPYTVAVDPNTGRLFIAGVTAGVVQIVEPG
ncbi:DNA-binding beta-propeller fold protein YncE [Mycolicibacterium iranicum]|uniref:DNA-binding beta-propeller fold protein YncE n=1 Tax=Mycolicibacterium iranicum TaxID=912594 RepID=A0A839Q7V1_MYCIR|nr:YncE family protein [Mycolicibacterium iranicum]MBB2991717.1 DNA-binding beta-propeller fold protein YncE [Mycolicibacterium iranicum]